MDISSAATSLIDLSIVVPVYGSEATLRALTDRLVTVLDAEPVEYEIVFVNDDRPDGAWTVLQELHAERPDCVSVVRLTRNFGQHNALMCGFARTRGRFVLTMDDDLQHPPEEVPKLLRAISEDQLDVVYGQYREKKHAAWRNLGSGVLNLVYRRVFHQNNQFTAFRIMRREIATSILGYDLNFAFIDGLIAWSTTRIGAVSVRHEPRQDGRSGYSLTKLALLALNMLTNFSLLPLQFASFLGIVAASGGLVVGLYYLALALTDRVLVPGYASTITAILFLGGVQLVSLGIIGEYVGRMHLNVNRKPQDLVREELPCRRE
jgi:undecaprenyl-phosphate 4-deoxy-4-formamido-L-arabinose transferase